MRLRPRYQKAYEKMGQVKDPPKKSRREKIFLKSERSSLPSWKLNSSLRQSGVTTSRRRGGMS